MTDVLQLFAEAEKATLARTKAFGGVEAARAKLAEAQRELDDAEAAVAPFDEGLSEAFAQLELAGVPREKADKIVGERLASLVAMGLIDAVEVNVDKPATPVRKRAAKAKDVPNGCAGVELSPPASQPAPVVVQPAVEPAVVTPPVDESQVVQPVVEPPAPESATVVAEPVVSEVQPASGVDGGGAPPLEDDRAGEDGEAALIVAESEEDLGGSDIPEHLDEEEEEVVVWDETDADTTLAETSPEPVVETAQVEEPAIAAARPGAARVNRPTATVAAAQPADAVVSAEGGGDGQAAELVPSMAPPPSPAGGGDLPDFLLD